MVSLRAIFVAVSSVLAAACSVQLVPDQFLGLIERGYRPPVVGERAFIVFQMPQVDDTWWTDPVVNVHFFNSCIEGDQVEDYYQGTKPLDVNLITGVKQTVKIPAGERVYLDYGWQLADKTCRVRGHFTPKHQFLYRFILKQEGEQCLLEAAEMARTISGVPVFEKNLAFTQASGGRIEKARGIATDWIGCTNLVDVPPNQTNTAEIVSGAAPAPQAIKLQVVPDPVDVQVPVDDTPKVEPVKAEETIAPIQSEAPVTMTPATEVEPQPEQKPETPSKPIPEKQPETEYEVQLPETETYDRSRLYDDSISF